MRLSGFVCLHYISLWFDATQFAIMWLGVARCGSVLVSVGLCTSVHGLATPILFQTQCNTVRHNDD